MSKHANFKFSDELPPVISLDKRRLRQKRNQVLQDLGHRIQVSTLGYSDDTAEPYKDHAETVHDFGDGWTVKKLKAYGDLEYEGQMMGHCIGGDSLKPCDYCASTDPEEEDYFGMCKKCSADGEPGTGTEDCDDCDGYGKVACEEQGPSCMKHDENGNKLCDTCAGAGVNECSDCDGDGSCGSCGGEGKISGTYAHYNDNYDSKKLLNTRGGDAYSLRDADNTPHVTWVENSGDWGADDYGDLTSVFGKQDKMPSPKHQKKVLQYAKARGRMGEEYGDSEVGVAWGTIGNVNYDTDKINSIVSGQREQDVRKKIENGALVSMLPNTGACGIHTEKPVNMWSNTEFLHTPKHVIEDKVHYSPAHDALMLNEDLDYQDKSNIADASVALPQDVVLPPKCTYCNHRSDHVSGMKSDQCHNYSCFCDKLDDAASRDKKQKALQTLPQGTQDFLRTFDDK